MYAQAMIRASLARLYGQSLVDFNGYSGRGGHINGLLFNIMAIPCLDGCKRWGGMVCFNSSGTSELIEFALVLGARLQPSAECTVAGPSSRRQPKRSRPAGECVYAST